MGHTNYWSRPAELPADKFAAAASDCQKILERCDAGLAGPDGQGEPVISNETIAFNGPAEQGFETFRIDRLEEPREGGLRTFNFCKTHRLPYDLYVQIVLIIFHHHFGETFQVLSDGGEPDWDRARSLCVAKLGYGGAFYLTRR